MNAESTTPRLPEFARIDRSLGAGMHPFVRILPEVARSPAFARIAGSEAMRQRLLAEACVKVDGFDGYCWVNVEEPCIMLAESYYREGTPLDLYLDLLHELTHVRQHFEGRDLWDERYSYVDRVTEIEGYAVAVEEGRRLGMSDEQLVRHLSNPWMTQDDVQKLVVNVEMFLGSAVAKP